MTKVYKNSTELANLGGTPFYMGDMVDACLLGRLNLFLEGDTGSGKIQLAKDAMSHFGDKSLFVLGRNDMDTRELFQQLNPAFFRALKAGELQKDMSYKELTDKIDTHLIVVDELPNCVPAVRAQLFNLFDGFIELNGKPYAIGNGYSVGIATGNIGQRFTESSNELGRALRDRMHVTIDTDYFAPKSGDTLEILASSTNPRVEFSPEREEVSQKIITGSKDLTLQPVHSEKLIIVNYLIHGLDHCNQGDSKRKMKGAWPNQVQSHGTGSDEALILPLSIRAAKSVTRLSQALDYLAREKGATEIKPFDSMMQAFKFVSAYSGVLNEVAVQENYAQNKYAALDAVMGLARTEFDRQKQNIAAGIYLAKQGKTSEKLMNGFSGRWEFMKDTLTHLANNAGEK